MAPPTPVSSKKVWTTLITNLDYLPGLFLLDYCLKKVSSKYPLVALYTDTFPEEGHAALDARSIPKQRIEYMLPTTTKDYSNDPRFYDCWSKLAPFGLVEYDRVVQLDSDMMIVKNMDELMTMELDPPELKGTGNKVFAAGHACVCNPLKKPHYPKDWIPANCAFTTQHGEPEAAQTQGAGPTAGLAMPNGGLQVVNPSKEVYRLIVDRMNSDAVANYEFADQSLLSDAFPGRWVGLPYVYNGLKTLRWPDVHSQIWRDDEVKNVHFILSPKPWEAKDQSNTDDLHAWWRQLNSERKEKEAKTGITDRF